MEGSLVTKLQQQTEGLKPLYVHAVGFSMGSFLPVGQYFFPSKMWRDTLYCVELYTELHDSLCSHFQMWMSVPSIMEDVNRYATTPLVVSTVVVVQAISWMKME